MFLNTDPQQQQSGQGRSAAASLSDVLPRIAGFASNASIIRRLGGDVSEMITTIAGSKSGRLKVQTVAVLPFVNMTANQDDEYFCDGLAEDLLNALAKIDALKVAARRSAFSFKGKSTTLSDIGTTLGVDNVVEGSIRRSGDRVRISVRLIKSSSFTQLKQGRQPYTL